MRKRKRPKTYKFRTIQECFDIVPASRIEQCLAELGRLLGVYKAALIIGLRTGHLSPKEMPARLPAEFVWTDDEMGELSVRGLRADGSAALELWLDGEQVTIAWLDKPCTSGPEQSAAE